MNNTKKRILIAEDEISLREMLVTVLKDENYQVDAAADGKEAWELLKKNYYDLIATDLYMPELNGVELIQACHESFPGLKTILFSGGGRDFEGENGAVSVKFKGQPVNVSRFLKKPCKLNELLTVVEILLQ
ncbi:MAG: response regulator [Gammaproteobacteria bacterium]|nr:response regulator [Gammaproteobacteria bacterium]